MWTHLSIKIHCMQHSLLRICNIMHRHVHIIVDVRCKYMFISYQKGTDIARDKPSKSSESLSEASKKEKCSKKPYADLLIDHRLDCGLRVSLSID